MATLTKHADVLKQIAGITVQTSQEAMLGHWRELWEGNADQNFERFVTVNKDSGTGAVSMTNVTRGQRKKYSYKAHVQACRRWAGLVFNEQTELQVSETVAEGAASSELTFLENHYEDAGVWPALEEHFPEMFGMGTVAAVTEFSSEFGIVHKFYQAEAIYPFETNQGRMRSVVFVSEFDWTDGKTYTLYNIHKENRGARTYADGATPPAVVPGGTSSYTIRNIIVPEDGKDSVPVNTFGLAEEYISPVRLFSVFRPFNRKIQGFNDAFGVPVYHDYQDMIAEIDEIYDIKQVDVQSSRRIVFVDKEALVYDAQGRANIPQHLHSTVISTKALEHGRGGDLKSNFVTEFAPTPNMDKYSLELQAAVNRFSDAVGLGTDAFKIERGEKATATQVVSEGQEKYSNLKKHLSIISSEFQAFNAAILSVARENKVNTALDPAKPIGFFVQDSVVIDDETRREIALQEVRDGLRSVNSYLEEFRGLSGKELEEELALLEEASDQDDLMAKLRMGDMRQRQEQKPGDEE